jgi:hypothetical protein
MAAITPIDQHVRGAHGGRLRPAPRSLFTLGLVLTFAGVVRAHDPGLSSIDIQVGSREVTVVLSVAGADAEMVGGVSALGQVALESIDLLVDGARLRGSMQKVFVDDEGTVHVRLIYQGYSGDRIVVQSLIPVRLGAGHRQLATVRAEDGSSLAERMLDARANEVVAIAGQVTTDGSGSPPARYGYLVLLAGLFPLVRRWWRIMPCSRVNALGSRPPQPTSLIQDLPTSGTGAAER